MLDDMHHLSSGFKAWATEVQYYGMDECRQACGGAGVLLSSGVAQMWADAAPNVTFEGVNVVMYQQSSRAMFKAIAALDKGKKVAGVFSYMNSFPTLLKSKCPAVTVADMLDLSTL